MKRILAISLIVTALAALTLAAVHVAAAAQPIAAPAVVSIAAPVAQQETPPDVDLSPVILGALGVVLSLAFRYIPELRTWYENLPHQGIVMLGFVVLVGAAYFGLSCTPFAAELQIKIACSTSSAWDVARAIFVIAVGNQLAYLFTPTPKG